MTTAPPTRVFTPETPSTIARRRFLQGALALGGTAMLGPTWLSGQAWAGPPLGSKDAILVIVMLGGGNDGLNTVAPVNNSTYRALRGPLALDPARSHAVGANMHLHPSLHRLKKRFDRGEVAFVHSVGDPTYDHSHFSAMARWMDGRPSPDYRSGWAGRTLDQLGLDLISGVSVGWSGLPLHMKGNSVDTIGMPPSGSLFGADRSHEHRIAAVNMAKGYGSVNHGKGALGDVVGGSMADAITVARKIAPAYERVTGDDLAQELSLCAQMINLDVGARILNVELGSFDTHDAQPDAHAQLLDELDMGIEVFFRQLDPRFASRVTLMTFSEFGRRAEANGSAGTDHGAGSTMIVAGDRVKGGHHGPFADLTQLTERGDIESRVDFRRYYATFIEQWFGVSSATVLGQRYAPLDLLHPPGSGGGAPKQPKAVLPPPGTMYAPLVPARLLDTRNGPGPYGPQETRTLKVTGVGGVPANGAGAVVLNVTSTAATARSFITAWPTGQPRPNASNVNTVPGDDVPNLVIAKVGQDGTISLYNHAGHGHLVVDVMGWMRGWR